MFDLYFQSQISFCCFPLPSQPFAHFHSKFSTIYRRHFVWQQKKENRLYVELSYIVNGVNCLLIPGKHRESIWLEKLNETQPNYSIDDDISLLSWLLYFLCGNKSAGDRTSVQLKGSLTRDFRLQVFFMNQRPPGPQVFHRGRFEFFRKFAEIFANEYLSPLSTTLEINCSPVSTTPPINYSAVSTTPAIKESCLYQLADT